VVVAYSLGHPLYLYMSAFGRDFLLCWSRDSNRKPLSRKSKTGARLVLWSLFSLWCLYVKLHPFSLVESDTMRTN